MGVLSRLHSIHLSLVSLKRCPAPDGLAATPLFCVASTGSVQLVQVLLAFQGLHGEGHMAAASDAVL